MAEWHRIITSPYTGSMSMSGSFNVDGNATITGNVTINGTASVENLVVKQIGYSSGSNQLGDAANDTQTLYGTVVIPTGSLTVTGSANVTGTQVASSGIGRTVLVSSSLSASANNDVLVGLDINPTFANGAFTGVSNFATRITGNTVRMIASANGAGFDFKSNLGIITTLGSNEMNLDGITATNLLVNGGIKARVLTNGNFLLGTTTDLSARLLVKGSGTTVSTTSLLVQNSAGTNLLSVRDDNVVNVGTLIPDQILFNGGTQKISVNGTGNATNFYSSGIIGQKITSQTGANLLLTPGTLPGNTVVIESTGGISPSINNSAILQANSTTQGFLLPRTNLTSNISTPAQGLQTYITSSATEGIWYYNSGLYQGWTRVLNNSGSQAIAGNLTVTGSLTVITGSTIEFQVNQTGVKIGNATTDSHAITGSVAITASAGTGSALTVYKSGSTVLDVQGSSGQLFSVTDSLTGSLFSVNTVAGLPVIEAFSDNTVNIGKYGTYPIKVVSLGTSAVISGSFSGSGADLSGIPASGIVGLNLSQIATGSVSASVGLGTGSFSIVSGSSNFLFINNSGSIGISTSTPFSTIPNVGSGSIDLVNPNGNVTVGGFAVLGKTSTNGYGAVGSNYYLDNANALRRRNNDLFSAIGFEAGGFAFYSAGGGAVGSSISATYSAVLNSSGNFTIGNGSTTLGARIGIKGSGTTSSTTSLLVQNAGATSSLAVLDNGNVGIGTTTPTAPLEVRGATNFSTALRIGGLNSGRDFTFNPYYATSVYGGFFGNDSGHITLGASLGTDNGSGIGIYLGGPSGNRTALLQVRGTGTTSSTTSFLVQNNAGSSAITVTDDRITTISGIRTTINTNIIQLQPASYFSLQVGGSDIYIASPTARFATKIIVGTIASDAVASAQFQIDGTTTGFLPPRTNITSNISAPAQGLQTYLTGSTNEGLYYYNSGSYQGWTRVLNNSGSQSISGSLELTSALTASNAIISGNVTVLGTASINTLIVNQTQLSTGSNQLGDAADDFQTLFGTVRIPTGSLTVTGSITSTGGFTGSLFGTASYVPTLTQVTTAGNITTNAIAVGDLTLGSDKNMLLQGNAYIFQDTTSKILAGKDSGAVYFGYNFGSQQIHIGSLGTGNILFRSAGNVCLENANSNLLVGTTTNSGFKFDVNGTGRFSGNLTVSGSATNSLLIRGSGTTSSTTSLLVQNSATTELLKITDDGFVTMATNGAGVTIGQPSWAQFRLGYITADVLANTISFIASSNNYKAVFSGNTIANFGFYFGGNATAHASSLIELSSTTKGFLVTRHSSTSNISAPAQGLMTYVTASATEGLYYYNSGSYQSWTRVLNSIGTQTITGSLSITGSAGTGSALTVYKSGSTVMSIQGSQGELFSITDSLSGSLFSVSNISGLPILEVFSDNTVLLGSYLDPMLITTQRLTANSGSTVIYSLPTASYDGVFVDYVIRSGSNARAGQFMGMWSGSSTNIVDSSTTDFGDTSGFVFALVVSGSNMVITGSASTSAWTVRAGIRSI